MARLQILELPTVYREDNSETPFVLVIDQATETTVATVRTGGDPSAVFSNYLDGLVARAIGARAVLVFEETIELPANQIAMEDGLTYPVTLKVTGDFRDFHDQASAEVRKAAERLRVDRVP